MGKENSWIHKYIKECKERIKDQNITICLGSEACDLDSFVCSIILSIHENAIPVINMKREIFEAKNELTTICEVFNLNINDLIFLEKLRNSNSHKPEIYFRTDSEDYQVKNKNIKLMLVDHHKPIEELSNFQMDTIIDHHTVTNPVVSARRIYIDTDAGSCCTLISKFVGHSLGTKKNKKNESFENIEMCTQMAKMLSIPIYFDTNKFKKVTSHFDRAEFRKLIKIAKTNEASIRELVQILKKARKNDDQLDTKIILQKDFKIFECNGIAFGYATVKYSFKKWIEREAANLNEGMKEKQGLILHRQFDSFRKENNLDFLLINSKVGSKRLLAFVNCPIEKSLAQNEDFSIQNYKEFQFYEIPMYKTRKILTPLIIGMLDKLSKTKP